MSERALSLTDPQDELGQATACGICGVDPWDPNSNPNPSCPGCGSGRTASTDQAILEDAGSYTRISKARGGPDDPETTSGVRRQAQDNEAHAASLRWRVAETYIDNDVTASGKQRRPEFERLLEDLEAGRFQRLVVWHPDRLLRVRGDLDRLVAICKRKGVQIATVKAGTMDLTTATGRLLTGILTEVATFELDHGRERLVAKHEQLARDGRPNGGGRPFGYEPDRRTLRAPYRYCRLRDRKEIVVDEPAVIRELARRTLDEKASLHGLAEWLNEEGVLPVRIGRWEHTKVRQILVSARISGRREVFGATPEGKKVQRGRIVGKAAWPAIISVDDSDALRREILSPTRRPLATGFTSKHILAGLIWCGLCNARLYSRGHGAMRCSGCGKVSIRAEYLDLPFAEAVIKRVDEGGLDTSLRDEDSSQVYAALVDVESRQRHLAAKWANDDMTTEAYEAADQVLATRRKVLTARLEAVRESHGLADLPSPLRAAWYTPPDQGGISHAQKRSLMGFFIAKVRVHPGHGKRGSGAVARIDADWKR